eukprot:1195656-Prorocentrum_minimum.AAC.3
MAPFIYQKKNKGPRDGAEVCEVYCKKFTCDIQICLQKLRPSPRTGQYDHGYHDHTASSCRRLNGCMHGAGLLSEIRHTVTPVRSYSFVRIRTAVELQRW